MRASTRSSCSVAKVRCQDNREDDRDFFANIEVFHRKCKYFAGRWSTLEQGLFRIYSVNMPDLFPQGNKKLVTVGIYATAVVKPR